MSESLLTTVSASFLHETIRAMKLLNHYLSNFYLLIVVLAKSADLMHSIVSTNVVLTEAIGNVNLTI